MPASSGIQVAMVIYVFLEVKWSHLFETCPSGFIFSQCGTYRDNRKGYTSRRANALTKKSERGTMRWIREETLVYVEWMDTWVVSLCSTIHPAFSGELVQRRVKGRDGHWAVKDIPCLGLPGWTGVSAVWSGEDRSSQQRELWWTPLCHRWQEISWGVAPIKNYKKIKTPITKPAFCLK